MIHKEICTYELCKLAKEKGFDLDCPMFYNPEGKLKYGWAYDPMNSGLDMRDMLCHNSKLPLGFGAECTAPTQSLLQRWLREEKGLHISIPLHKGEYKYFWAIDSLNRKKKVDDIAYNLFDTYELALEDAIKFALKNLV